MGWCWITDIKEILIERLIKQKNICKSSLQAEKREKYLFFAFQTGTI
jgi:hypothetical protein